MDVIDAIDECIEDIDGVVEGSESWAAVGFVPRKPPAAFAQGSCETTTFG